MNFNLIVCETDTVFLCIVIQLKYAFVLTLAPYPAKKRWEEDYYEMMKTTFPLFTTNSHSIGQAIGCY